MSQECNSVWQKLFYFIFNQKQVSGDHGNLNAIWNCEGVQVGGLGSSFGILGSWTTIFHDIDDPVGEESHLLVFECVIYYNSDWQVSLWKQDLFGYANMKQKFKEMIYMHTILKTVVG